MLIGGALVGSMTFLYTYVATASSMLAFVTGIFLGGLVPKMFEHHLNKLSDHVRRVFSPQQPAGNTPGNTVLSPWKRRFLERTYDATSAQIEQRISWMRELVGKLSLLTEHHVGRAAALLRDGPDRLQEAAASLAVAVLHAADYPDVQLPEQLLGRILLPLRASPDELLARLRAQLTDTLHACAPAEDLPKSLDTARVWFSAIAGMSQASGSLVHPVEDGSRLRSSAAQTQMGGIWRTLEQ